MNSSDRARTVYKYLHPDRVDVLKDGTIRASQVDLLNDPFDALPDFSTFERYLNEISEEAIVDRYLNSPIIVPNVQITSQEREEVRQLAKSNAAQFQRNIRGRLPLMLCLSETNNNLLMWSHYAKAHSGFVLGFDAEHEFFAGPRPGPSNTSRLRKVEYHLDRPLYPDPRMGMTEETFMPIVLRKSVDWAYEREWRMLVKPQACRSLGKVGYHECLVLDWPAELLTEIILGPMMSLGNKARIMEISRTRYPHAELFEAKLSPTKYNLDISYIFLEQG